MKYEKVEKRHTQSNTKNGTDSVAKPAIINIEKRIDPVFGDSDYRTKDEFSINFDNSGISLIDGIKEHKDNLVNDNCKGKPAEDTASSNIQSLNIKILKTSKTTNMKKRINNESINIVNMLTVFEKELWKKEKDFISKDKEESFIKGKRVKIADDFNQSYYNNYINTDKRKNSLDKPGIISRLNHFLFLDKKGLNNLYAKTDEKPTSKMKEIHNSLNLSPVIKTKKYNVSLTQFYSPRRHDQPLLTAPQTTRKKKAKFSTHIHSPQHMTLTTNNNVTPNRGNVILTKPKTEKKTKFHTLINSRRAINSEKLLDAVGMVNITDQMELSRLNGSNSMKNIKRKKISNDYPSLIPYFQESSSSQGSSENSNDDNKTDDGVIDDRTSIKILNNVYDSLEDAEDENNIELLFEDNNDEDRWVFGKNSTFRNYWSTLIFFLIVYSVTISPFYLAFYELEGDSNVMIDIIVDILFIIDIILNFFTPYYNDDGNFISNHKKIALNYLEFWFALDLMSSFPTGLLNYIIPDDLSALKKLFRLSRLYRLGKWLKVFRLIKLAKNSNTDELLSSMKFIYSLEINRIILFTGFFLILMHVATCLWIYIGRIDDGIQNWIYTYKFIDYDTFSLYIASLYFTICTVFAIGFGDITSVNFSERVYNISFMLVGVVVFSFCLSSLSSLFSKLDVKALNLQKKFKILEEIVKEYKIPNILLNKIRKTIKHEIKKTNIERYEFIESLPTTIKNEIFLLIHKQHIKQLQFFKQQPHDFILFVLSLFKPLPLTKGDTLFTIGEFVEEMYLVVKGNLSLNLGPLYDSIEIAQIRNGNHIGDVLLYLHEQSPYELKCKSDNSELLVIKRIDFFRIKMQFYQNMLYILQMSMKRMELFEKRRFIVMHLRKFENNPKEIYRKMRNLNIILMNKDFDNYYYNEGEFQDIHDFIETLEDNELMDILNINKSKVNELRKTIFGKQIHLTDQIEQQDTLRDNQFFVNDTYSNINTSSIQSPMIFQNSKNEDQFLGKRVKFKLQSKLSNNSISNENNFQKQKPRIKSDKDSSKHISNASLGNSVRSKSRDSYKNSDSLNQYGSNNSLGNNISSKSEVQNKIIGNENENKKSSITRLSENEIKHGSKKKRSSKKYTAVKKIVNEILLVNKWKSGYTFNSNMDSQEQQVTSPPISLFKDAFFERKRSSLGGLNLNSIKNELIYNEKAGNMMSTDGGNLHLRKIKSELEELGEIKKKSRRGSIAVLNSLSNNLAEIRSINKSPKHKTSNKFLREADLTVNDKSKNPTFSIDGNQNQFSNIDNCSNNINEKNVNNFIMNTTKNTTTDNHQININVFKLETNYNQNYIILDDKNKRNTTNINPNRIHPLRSPKTPQAGTFRLSDPKTPTDKTITIIGESPQVTTLEMKLDNQARRKERNIEYTNLNEISNINNATNNTIDMSNLNISMKQPIDNKNSIVQKNDLPINKLFQEMLIEEDKNNSFTVGNQIKQYIENQNLWREKKKKRSEFNTKTVINPKHNIEKLPNTIKPNELTNKYITTNINKTTVPSRIKNGSNKHNNLENHQTRTNEKGLTKNYKKIDRLYYLLQKLIVYKK